MAGRRHNPIACIITKRGPSRLALCLLRRTLFVIVYAIAARAWTPQTRLARYSSSSGRYLANGLFLLGSTSARPRAYRKPRITMTAGAAMPR